MLQHARRRAEGASCPVLFVQDDVCTMSSIPPDQFDWVVACFLEMVYSKDAKLRRRQDRFARFVEKVYDARFERNTLEHAKNTPGPVVTGTRFVKQDTYLLIEGRSGK
jgi:hypothetical protein